MKKVSALNKESIVFIVDRDDVRRLVGMYLAAAGLNARTYPDCDEYRARHDSSKTEYLVLDMPFPALQGLVIRQQRTVNGESPVENPGISQGVPVKTQHSHESFPFTKRMSNAVIMSNDVNIRIMRQ